MDFVTSLLLFEGKDAIFVANNHLNKYAHLIRLTTKFIATEVVDLFFKHVFPISSLTIEIPSLSISYGKNFSY